MLTETENIERTQEASCPFPTHLPNLTKMQLKKLRLWVQLQVTFLENYEVKIKHGVQLNIKWGTYLFPQRVVEFRKHAALKW